MTIPMTPTARSVPIAGLVDGQLTTQHDHEGNVCMHLTFVFGLLCDRVHVELVLSQDDAGEFQRSLAGRLRGATEPMPCRVGLRVGPGYA